MDIQNLRKTFGRDEISFQETKELPRVSDYSDLMSETFNEADVINEHVVYEDGISIPLLREHAVKFRYNECTYV